MCFGWLSDFQSSAPRGYRVIPFHMVAAVWNSLLMAATYTGLRYSWNLLAEEKPFEYINTLGHVFSMSLGVDCMLYLMILVGVYAFRYYNESRERMYEAAELNARLAEVQLQALKMQIAPAFFIQCLPYSRNAHSAKKG